MSKSQVEMVEELLHFLTNDALLDTAEVGEVEADHVLDALCFIGLKLADDPERELPREYADRLESDMKDYPRDDYLAFRRGQVQNVIDLGLEEAEEVARIHNERAKNIRLLRDDD